MRSWGGWCNLVLTREIVLYIICTVKVNVADPRSRSSTEIRVSFPSCFSLNGSEGEDNIE